MKFKLLLLISFVSAVIPVCSQVYKPMPTEEEWQSYFYSRKKSIEKKLYQLATEGKLKAYKTDSLLSTYNLLALKRQGERVMIYWKEGEKAIDSVYIIPFDRDFKDIWFLKKILSSPFDETETNNLKAIALTHRSYYGGLEIPQTPFCWFSLADLKIVLNKDEYNWIKLVYYYTNNDNNFLFREGNSGDCFWHLNIYSKDILHCDSSLLRKIGNSMYGSYFYINDYLRDEEAGMPNPPILYDHQVKKYISYTDFQKNYHRKLIIPNQVTPDNSFFIVDTVIFETSTLNNIKSVEIDQESYAIRTFHFEIIESDETDKINKFSIDANRIRERNTAPTIFWFFEDYFRWKN